jgi:nickel-dependent lactate racemase
MKFALTYGLETREFEIPDDRVISGPISPRKVEPMSGTVADIIKSELERPVDSPTLSEIVPGRKVGFLIADEFRAGLQETICRTVLAEILRHDPAEVTVFVATGSHDAAIYAHRAPEWTDGVRVIPNDCDDASHVLVGTTERGTPVRVRPEWLECDLRVYGHESKHHYMCGYSNIDKLVLPGLSARESIVANHKLSLHHDRSVAGVSPWHADPARRDNPFATDAREARAMAERYVRENGELNETEVVTFAVDMISAGDKIYWIGVGDPGSVTTTMTGEADALASVEVEPARYVVVSPGGPPACNTVYGTQNCFDIALTGAIETGGEALVLAPCIGRPDVPEEARGLAGDLKSKRLFWDTLVKLLNVPADEAETYIEENFQLYLWKTDRVLKLFNRKGLAIDMYCELPEETLAAGGFGKSPDIQEWIDERVARNDGKFNIIDQGNKTLVRTRTGQ